MTALQRALVVLPDPGPIESAVAHHQKWARAQQGYSDLLILVAPRNPDLAAYRRLFDPVDLTVDDMVDGVGFAVQFPDGWPPSWLSSRMPSYAVVPWETRQPLPGVRL